MTIINIMWEVWRCSFSQQGHLNCEKGNHSLWRDYTLSSFQGFKSQTYFHFHFKIASKPAGCMQDLAVPSHNGIFSILWVKLFEPFMTFYLSLRSQKHSVRHISLGKMAKVPDSPDHYLSNIYSFWNFSLKRPELWNNEAVGSRSYMLMRGNQS